MEILLQIYRRLLAEVKPSYYRAFYRDFTMDHRIVGVVGARGVGKTTFLLQYLRQQYGESEKGLYISGDNLYFSDRTLVQTADEFVKFYAGELLCIDEIHKYKNWRQELKNIYDSYPNLRILFSGSSSIDLMKGKYDLSRRVILREIYGFSFREFLEIQTGNSYPIMKLENILNPSKHVDREMSTTQKLLGHLHEYWKKGYYPTNQELPVYQAFRDTLIGIIDKTIYEDISTFYSLKTENLDTLKKIMYFFATSRPGSISINKLAKSLGKDHTTISEFVQMLRDTGLLRFLMIDKYGHALVRNTEKIYLDNTNLLYAVNTLIEKDVHIGSVRELFVIGALENAGYTVLYSKMGDIVCDGYLFEIGGAQKTIDQIKGRENAFIVKDDVLYASAHTIPLYLFGFLR